MNKSWKTFDSLIKSPSARKSLRKLSPRTATNALRVFAKLRRTGQGNAEIHQDKNFGKKLFRSKQVVSLGDESIIEDFSDEEHDKATSNTRTNIEFTSDSCELSLQAFEVVSEHLQADVDDVSVRRLEKIHETESSEGSDCESIQCKRTRKIKLNFYRQRTRRITDDLFIIPNATERTESCKRNLLDTTHGGSKEKGFSKIVCERQVSNYRSFDRTFRSTKKLSETCQNSSRNKWSSLNETFRSSLPAEIDDPSSSPEYTENANEILIQQAPDNKQSSVALHKSNLLQFRPQMPKVELRQDCQLSRLIMILNERNSRRDFWLHECQTNSMNGNGPYIVESIIRIFGRTAITYYDTDRDDPSIQLQHIIYLDPAEKQLKYIKKGSLIEVEYDLEGHKLDGQKMTHLGVFKIKLKRS
ncbi:uncharacterized protein LOC131440179 [Malaya genurostris]|uniref:uncharacterized protein LOC131440179 n=1 Tax=Malaya genurostris TaxID=325434 RepID=UPI0026F3B1C9|nr:uncharacterized protein LOC131440179 [Malaya genurostris]